MTPPGSRPDLPTTYSPSSAEEAVYRRWVELGVFTPSGGSDRPAYAIVIPPPNVTGQLHMGHAFQHTLMDALTRRRRMQGYDALWLPGTDHAGIATQNVVERALAQEGASRHDLGREKFVERVWQWRADYGDRIFAQMRRLGDGVDWSRTRFTMDAGLSRAVRTIFARMFHDGLIYRAQRIINWCPRCLTALSDIEVESTEDDGELVSISYGPVTVATTRIETLLGDTAVAVHPDDPRYRDLIGTQVRLPLTDRWIPVIGDEHVDPAFGTGAVKVTPAHDPNDFAIGQRHDLPSITMMDERGIITTHGPFQGLDRFEARSAILAALRAEGRIVAEKRPYLHAVPHCDRCKTAVEPRLSLQWFVAVETLARAAGDMVRDGRVAISPPELSGRFFGWVDDMHDWCVSRQLWWGHRIPVWYCPDGHTTVPAVGDEMTDPVACHVCGNGELRQDADVLDTWFSSGLWPFSTLGWPDTTADLARFYPTDVLLTGYDIIFFWVARMMMFASYTLDDVPFRTVVLTGLVRDARGKKMSKSWGNVIDPLDLIDRHGADALRFALARGAHPGVDVPLSEESVEGSRNFVNKLWNATRFALMNGAIPAPGALAGRELSTADRWILSRLTAVVGQVDQCYEEFEFARSCDAVFHFARDELFDWYLELAKSPLRTGGERADTVRAVLGRCFDTILRLLHPVMPFVTETLWSALTAGHQGAPGQNPASHDNTAPQNTAPQNTAAQNTATQNTAAQNTATQNTAAQNTAAQNTAAQNTATRDTATRDTAGEQAASCLAAAAWPRAGEIGDHDSDAEAWIGELQLLVTEVRRFRSAQRLRSNQRVPAVLVAPARMAAWAEQIGALTALEVTVADAPPTQWPSVVVGASTVALDLTGVVDIASERTRLQRMLATERVEQARIAAKLANPMFAERAPAAVVAKTRQRLTDAESAIAQLTEQISQL
ncbi:valine--tRNA ligase [Frankia sp. QA3]|uniref:valine--tRNA ligase n=1 Tax=Frankia sp. QA3 TaxID=710111 RepID=UPI0009FDC87E|nr:valine--tRNA ligase [Frankia sp. QA3]